MDSERARSPLAKGAARSAVIRLMLFAAVVALVYAGAAATGVEFSVERIRIWGEGLGPAGPLLYVPFAVLANCLLVPFPALAGAAGLLFGTLTGTVVAIAVVTLAAPSQLLITRYLARGQVEALLPARVRAFDGFLERRGFWAVLYTRLVPGIPFVLLNYAAGLTRLKAWHMAAGTGIAKSPRAYAYTALGGSLANLAAPEAQIAIAVFVVMTLVGLFLARGQVLGELRARRSRRAAP